MYYPTKEIPKHPLFRPFIGMAVYCEGSKAGEAIGHILDIGPSDYLVYFGIKDGTAVCKPIAKHRVQILGRADMTGDKSLATIQTLYNNLSNQLFKQGFEFQVRIASGEKVTLLDVVLSQDKVLFQRSAEVDGSPPDFNALADALIYLYGELLERLSDIGISLPY